MKFVIERAPLLRTLGHLQSVVERRATIMVLQNIKIVAAGPLAVGQVRLSGTDMDVELTESIAANVAMPGEITVPAQTVYDVVRKLSDGAQIEFELDSTRQKSDPPMTVRSGRSTFKLPTIPVIDYPIIKAVEADASFALPAADLRKMIDATRFAMSTEEVRYYLNGLYLHTAQNAEKVGVLRAVSTDGHRLARFDLPLPEGARGMKGIIVPRKTVLQLIKLVEDAGKDAEVAIRASDIKIEFSIGGATMISKVIDGTFPDYDRVIPTSNDKIVKVVRKDFAEAVDRVATISSERSRGVKFDLGPNNITLSVRSDVAGLATEDVDACYTGDKMDVGFNSRYLLDITNQIAGDEVQFMLANAGAPALLCDPKNAAALFVLMPMRVV